MFIDCWNWFLSKTYITSAASECGPFEKGNDEKRYRTIKRTYKCKDNRDVEKQIVARYLPGVKATVRSGNYLENAEQYVAVLYTFKDAMDMIPPSQNSRTYPSLKGSLSKILKGGKTPEKATNELYLTALEV